MSRVLSSPTDYQYMCSEVGPGTIIKNAIRENTADRRGDLLLLPAYARGDLPQDGGERRGLNPYMVEIANIREQCSWIHKDMEDATEKAIILGQSGYRKGAVLTRRCTAGESPVTKRALVIGGGIAGIQTALDIADAGFEVDIVEKTAHHRRQDDPDRQDVPDARLRRVYSDPENGGLRAEREDSSSMHTARCRTVGGFVGNFTREDPQARRAIVDEA